MEKPQESNRNTEPQQEQLRELPGFMSHEVYIKLRRGLVHIADVTGHGEDLYLGSGSKTLISAREEAQNEVLKQAAELLATHILIVDEKPHEVFTWAHTTRASLYRRMQGQLPQPKQQP